MPPRGRSFLPWRPPDKPHQSSPGWWGLFCLKPGRAFRDGRADNAPLVQALPHEPPMIIDSLLDTDLYKFSMMQVVLHQYPAAQVEYRFKCRNPGIDLVPYVDEIRAELKALCQLRFTPDELDYLRTWRFIKSDFVDFLALFQLNEKYVAISPSVAANGEIDIRIRGPWLHTILFEVPLLAIVNEVYFRHAGAGL